MAAAALIGPVAVVVPASLAAADSSPVVAERVIVLHGLWRSDRAMAPLAAALVDAGYEVDNLRYSSVRRPIEDHVAVLAARVERCCEGEAAAGGTPPRVHFVGHSLGGIVVRAYLEQRRPRALGRVVMLAPPNAGSEVVDVLQDSLPLGFVLGPTGRKLGTDPRSLAVRLGPPSFDVGVVAGNRSINPLFSWIIPGEDDGAVSVEATKLEGMRDFIVVPHSHTFIMTASDVHDLVISFLRNGRFRDGDP